MASSIAHPDLAGRGGLHDRCVDRAVVTVMLLVFRALSALIAAVIGAFVGLAALGLVASLLHILQDGFGLPGVFVALVGAVVSGRLAWRTGAQVTGRPSRATNVPTVGQDSASGVAGWSVRGAGGAALAAALTGLVAMVMAIAVTTQGALIALAF